MPYVTVTCAEIQITYFIQTANVKFLSHYEREIVYIMTR